MHQFTDIYIKMYVFPNCFISILSFFSFNILYYLINIHILVSKIDWQKTVSMWIIVHVLINFGTTIYLDSTLFYTKTVHFGILVRNLVDLMQDFWPVCINIYHLSELFFSYNWIRFDIRYYLEYSRSLSVESSQAFRSMHSY